MEKVTPGARGNPPLWAVTEKKTERSASTRIRCHHFLTLLSSSFFCSRSRLCLSSVVRDALASVMSRAALLPAEDSRALATPLSLSRSLSLSLRGNRFVTLPKGPSLNQTRLLPPREERERESWDGKGMRGGDSTGREARRRPQTKNREELGLPRVQWPRNSFSRCPPPVRFLLVF